MKRCARFFAWIAIFGWMWFAVPASSANGVGVGVLSGDAALLALLGDAHALCLADAGAQPGAPSDIPAGQHDHHRFCCCIGHASTAALPPAAVVLPEAFACALAEAKIGRKRDHRPQTPRFDACPRAPPART